MEGPSRSRSSTNRPTESGSSEMPRISQVTRSGGHAVARRAAALTRVDGTPLPPPLRDGGPFELISTDFGPFWMQTSDEVMRPYLLRRRRWGDSAAELLRRLLTPGARYLDVGATVGYFSVFVHLLARDIQIDAVEPHPILYGLLQSNLWGNGVAARTYNTALGDERRLLPMSSAPMNLADSRLGAHKPDERYDLIVPVIQADELFARRSFDVVKISVQGFEPEVILGMQRIISDSPAIVLVVDFWPTALVDRGLDPLEVLNRYRQMGLHIAVNDDGGTGTSTAEGVIDHCRSPAPAGR